MLKSIHATAGAFALTIISCFWLATVISELFTSPQTIATVKGLILWGMALLVPALVMVGGSGTYLGKGWRLPVIKAKSRRMKLIASNGLLILLPSATFLAMRADAEQLDTIFYAVQALELLAGATNIILLSLSFRDGLSLRRRRIQKTP